MKETRKKRGDENEERRKTQFMDVGPLGQVVLENLPESFYNKLGSEGC